MDYRSILAVPILNKGRPVGAIVIGCSATGSFPKRQIELVETFADQAVIAIENVRLFEDVQKRTAELTELIGATDRDLRGVAGHLELARRVGAGVPDACWRTRPASARPSSANVAASKVTPSRMVAMHGAPPAIR